MGKEVKRVSERFDFFFSLNISKVRGMKLKRSLEEEEEEGAKLREEREVK